MGPTSLAMRATKGTALVKPGNFLPQITLMGTDGPGTPRFRESDQTQAIWGADFTGAKGVAPRITRMGANQAGEFFTTDCLERLRRNRKGNGNWDTECTEVQPEDTEAGWPSRTPARFAALSPAMRRSRDIGESCTKNIILRDSITDGTDDTDSGS